MSFKTPFTTPNAPIDVLVIGAGPAALSLGYGLSRMLHTAIFFSSGEYRNKLASRMHNVITWDHQDPAAFRAAARKELTARYATNYFEEVKISTVEKSARDDGASLFKAVDINGKEWWGRKLVLATGIEDVMPDIEGYEECWATGIFHCLFCHGYEESGAASVGLLAIDDCAVPTIAMHMARMANNLADTVTIYTNGSVNTGAGIKNILSALKPESKSRKYISVDERRISKLVKGPKGSQVEVHLEDGEVKIEGFVTHKPKSKLNGSWVEQLGLEITEQGDIKVNFPFNETSVAGVFAIGDCATMMKAVATGLAMGGATAAGVSAQL